MKVTALSLISHDGKDYSASQVIEVTEAQAKSLIAAGVAEAEQRKEPAQETPEKVKPSNAKK